MCLQQPYLLIGLVAFEPLALDVIPLTLETHLLGLPSLLIVGDFSCLCTDLGQYNVEACSQSGLLHLGLLGEQPLAGSGGGGGHAQIVLTLTDHGLRLQAAEGRPMFGGLDPQRFVNLGCGDRSRSRCLDLTLVPLAFDHSGTDDLEPSQGGSVP